MPAISIWQVYISIEAKDLNHEGIATCKWL